jgi:hypothetical protein
MTMFRCVRALLLTSFPIVAQTLMVVPQRVMLDE